MLLHFVLELLCSIILATDTSYHSASLNLGSAESRYSCALRLPRVGGGGEKGSFDQCLGVGVTLCGFDTLALFRTEKRNGMSIVLTIPGWGRCA